PNDAAEFAEGLVEAIPPAVGTQPAEQERRRDGSCFDREHHLEKVLPMGLDQSMVSLNGLSMCRYRVSFDGRKKRRSFQLRIRGMSLMPSKCARPNTGVDWAWVSP